MNNRNNTKNKMPIGHFLLLSLITVLSCSEPPPETIEVLYETDMEEFVNPERGFYRPFGTRTSDFVPLQRDTLLQLRKPNPAAGGFSVGSTLTYRSYQLDLFREAPLDSIVLNNIQIDMNTIREVGNKVILRFSYTSDCCSPPFNDAPKSTILKHLEQLKPILKKNVDIIAVVQMGFIGPWGEQYYSDYFGDLEHGPVTNKNWIDRQEVIEALLKTVPKSRMIQVRAPYYKLRFFDKEKASPEKALPLRIENAFDQSDKARIAHHNDCMLANYDDYWTYNSFHEWPPVSDTLNLKEYIAAETKFLVFGGETCPGGTLGEDVYDPYNNCISDGGMAQQYLKRFHTSFLNTSWSGAVNGDWTNKCIDEIKRNLGYRFVLQKGIFPKVIRNNEPIQMQLYINNEGYASTYNSRTIELVLRSHETQKVYKQEISADPRYWFTDELQTINVDMVWQETLAKGSYELFLNLPDSEPSLNNRPEYAIRLASKRNLESIWDPETGWNVLMPNIQVN
ncbi:MAG: DUF4832 domain-containing protein [Flavobacteriaceae bacterium]